MPQNKSPMSDAELCDYLRQDIEGSYAQREAAAAQRQAEIAKDLGEDRRSIDGVGRCVAEIDTEIAGELRQRYGQGCLKDPDFLQWHQKQNPGSRVKSGGTRGVTITAGISFK